VLVQIDTDPLYLSRLPPAALARTFITDGVHPAPKQYTISRSAFVHQVIKGVEQEAGFEKLGDTPYGTLNRLTETLASGLKKGTRLSQWQKDFLSKGDVFSLGVALMDILATCGFVVTTSEARTTLVRLYALARAMVQIDVSARPTGQQTFERFKYHFDEPSTPA
jgi:hypothetical protein